MSVDSLFRQEALEYRASPGIGALRIAPTLGGWVTTALVVCLMIALGAFLGLGHFTRKARVQGELTPILGVVAVISPTAGVVSQTQRTEGDNVVEGDVLTVVSAGRATSDGDTLDEIMRQIQVRLEALEADTRSQRASLASARHSLEQRLLLAKRELEQIKEEIILSEKRTLVAQGVLNKFRTLDKRNYVSELQIRAQEEKVLERIAATKELQRATTSAEQQAAQLRHELVELPTRLDKLRASHLRQAAQLSQEATEARGLEEHIIRAPITGLLASNALTSGKSVRQGEVLMTLLPSDATLQADLWVPSSAIGFIKPGDAVQLRYHAYPYQKFGHRSGRVQRVSRTPSLREAEASVGERGAGAGFFRVVVGLDDQHIRLGPLDEPLRPGMTLDADILLERRSILEWMFEPLFELRESGSENG